MVGYSTVLFRVRPLAVVPMRRLVMRRFTLSIAIPVVRLNTRASVIRAGTEGAQAPDVSLAPVNRDWAVARAWLHCELASRS